MPRNMRLFKVFKRMTPERLVYPERSRREGWFLSGVEGHPPPYVGFLQNLALRVVVTTFQHCLGYALFHS
jgi:hypothetical protein